MFRLLGRPLRAALLAAMVMGSLPAQAAPADWEQWVHLGGVFDLAGPRSDGRLVAAASGRLYLIDPASGAVAPFANGPAGYAAEDGPESYIALSTGWRVASAGCDFPADTLYVLRLKAPIGIDRVDAEGVVSQFVSLPDVDTLGGITFDEAGSFGHRLIVVGPHAGHEVVDAIDCKGGVTTITNSGPAVEGGIAVAPAGFGSHAGQLIAPDELSGRVIAIAPDGSSSVLVQSGLPAGGDIGVESVGFVPPGFGSAGRAYLSDRLTPGNPHSGNDFVLRLRGDVLQAAGARPGDLLVSTEGNGATIAVSCAASCSIVRLGQASANAHIEGRLLVVPERVQPPASPLPEARHLGSGSAGRWPQTLLLVGLAGGLALLLIAALALVRRRRRA